MSTRLYAVLLAGAALRLALFSSPTLVQLAGPRLELTTPVTSWKSRGCILQSVHCPELTAPQSRKASTSTRADWIHTKGASFDRCVRLGDVPAAKAHMSMQAPLLLPLFQALGDRGASLVLILADVGTAASVAGVARSKGGPQPWWIAML
jgi:hypothetical protein